MGYLLPILAFGAAGIGIYKAFQAQATAEDLRFSVQKIKPRLKGMKLTDTTVPFDVEIGIGNARNGKIKIEVIDVSFSVNDRILGRIQQYGMDFKIKPASFQVLPLTLNVSASSFLLVLGPVILTAITTYKTSPSEERKAKVLALMPKKGQAKGVIRANGIAFPVDTEFPINVDL